MQFIIPSFPEELEIPNSGKCCLLSLQRGREWFRIRIWRSSMIMIGRYWRSRGMPKVLSNSRPWVVALQVHTLLVIFALISVEPYLYIILEECLTVLTATEQHHVSLRMSRIYILSPSTSIDIIILLELSSCWGDDLLFVEDCCK